MHKDKSRAHTDANSEELPCNSMAGSKRLYDSKPSHAEQHLITAPHEATWLPDRQGRARQDCLPF